MILRDSIRVFRLGTLRMPFVYWAKTKEMPLLSRKSLKSEHRSRNHMTQGVQEQVTILSAIEPEAHFFKVGREMLCANMMPRSANAPLEQRERVFDSVCMNVSHYIDFLAVIDRLVFARRHTSTLDCGWVRRVIVGEDHIDILADVFADVIGERPGFHIFGMKQSKFAITLPNSDYDFLILQAAFPAASLVYPANEGFIHFDFSVKHGLVQLDHSGPDAMAEIPCCLVADSNRPLDLTGRNTLLGFAQEQGGHKPLRQRQVGIVKDRSSSYRKLIVAILAVEEFLFGFEFDSGLLAARAFNASGPAETAQQFAASFVSRELVAQVC